MGITIKKIITKACAVTITLYWCSLPVNKLVFPNLSRIYILIEAPNRAAQNPNKKYNVPISLWFVEKSHRIKLVVLRMLDCKSEGFLILKLDKSFRALKALSLYNLKLYFLIKVIVRGSLQFVMILFLQIKYIWFLFFFLPTLLSIQIRV
jgi:hypothetical protein